jgi:unsaturated chondroitin disaccharide hydrolase
MMDDINLLKPKLLSVIPFAERQLAALTENHPGEFPLYTQGGKWHLSGDRWTNWCEGFLGGQLWILHEMTGSSGWRQKAEVYSRLIAERRFDRSVHDLGFLFMSTWKRWYDLTGDETLRQGLIEAGQTLAKRFMPAGGYLCSFLGPDSLFIDIMMNVRIIFFAAKETNDPALWEIARKHCDTTRRRLVRGDGSTAHEGMFDLQSGEFLRQSTQQGWRGDSCWARGLAWAMYGFSSVYEYTADPHDLQTAELCSQYYLEHVAEGGLPPNDFDEQRASGAEQALAVESSAGIIAAGGLWRLAKQTRDPGRAQVYRSRALRTLETLLTPEYLAAETPGWEGLIKHGTYHQRKGLGVDESVMWGDYFFLELVHEVWKDG